MAAILFRHFWHTEEAEERRKRGRVYTAVPTSKRKEGYKEEEEDQLQHQRPAHGGSQGFKWHIKPQPGMRSVLKKMFLLIKHKLDKNGNVFGNY